MDGRRDSAILHIYAPRAYKTYETRRVVLHNGRIPVRSLLDQLRPPSLSLLSDNLNDPVMLLAGEDGYSLDSFFTADTVYKLRKEG